MSNAEMSREVERYWVDFLAQTGRPADTPLYSAFHFDDNEHDANLLAELVIRGTKRATASLLWQYGDGGERAPVAGDLSVVTDFGGTPLCVIETTAVDIRAFGDVDADFAAAEGEGDGSLEHWRRVHERYFGRVCEEIGREPSPRMEVVCERFRVIHPTR